MARRTTPVRRWYVEPGAGPVTYHRAPPYGGCAPGWYAPWPRVRTASYRYANRYEAVEFRR
jgi:hypothetical protein